MTNPANDQEAFVLRFLADWSTSDAALLTACFTEDGLYRNIPSPVAQGRPAIQSMIEGFFSFASFRMEILGVASRGDTVYTERIDHLTFTDTSRGTLPLPVFGVFELENGLIRQWREYLDLHTVEEASGLTFH